MKRIFSVPNFKESWQKLEDKWGREKAIVLVSALPVVLLTLWIAHSNPEPNAPNDIQEIGVVIPAGQLVVPLELANAAALNALVNRNGIVDLFKTGEKIPLVENLRIIKLTAGEGPLFGALVPDKMAGQLQDVFANPKLRAAIRTNKAGPTRFHLQESSKSSVLEISTGDNI
jgi:hypothetical protein